MLRSNSVNITISGAGVKWKEEFKTSRGPDSRYQQIRSFGFESSDRRIINTTRARLYPVRTNQYKSFAKDFFLPTIMNHTIYDLEKIQSTMGKVIKIAKDLFLDIITFPLRLLTCLPRIIMNYSKKENSLLTYLKQQDNDNAQKLVELDSVVVLCDYDYYNDPIKRSYNYSFIEVPVSSISAS